MASYFSQVLLTNKLDGDIPMSFFSVSSPLLVSFLTLIIMSFNSKGGNKCKYSDYHFWRLQSARGADCNFL